MSDERVVSYCPPIAYQPLPVPLLFPQRANQAPDLPMLREHLKREGRLTNEAIMLLISQVTDLMTSEPNVVRIHDPVTILGDLHGQFYDL